MPALQSYALNKTGGYVAITTVLIVGVIILVISLTTALTSVNQSQFSLHRQYAIDNLSLTESCVDEALINLNENNLIPSTITLPLGSCSLTVDSNVGTTWVFTVTSTHNSTVHSVRVNATRDTIIKINSWQEI